MGEQTAGGGEVELQHAVNAEFAGDSLVGERRVDVAVADDVLSVRQCRRDHALDELGARGGEERRLRPRAHLEAVEQHPPHLLAERRATGLALFDEVRPEVCFHLAAQIDVRVSVDRPDLDADVNVVGTLRVLEAARAHATKLVFSSTGGAIYGECEAPADEDHPRRPLAPYGVSKLAAEEYIAAYNRLYGTGHVSLRYGNVFGPRQDPHGEAGVVAIFMN